MGNLSSKPFGKMVTLRAYPILFGVIGFFKIDWTDDILALSMCVGRMGSWLSVDFLDGEYLYKTNPAIANAISVEHPTIIQSQKFEVSVAGLYFGGSILAKSFSIDCMRFSRSLRLSFVLVA